MSDETLISDIQSKIEREKLLIDGFQRIRQSAQNPAVQANTDVQIRDSRRNIQYFESKLNELQMRRGMGNMSMGGSGPGGGQGYGAQSGYGAPYGPQDVGTDYGSGGYSTSQNPATGPPRAPFAPPGPGGGGGLRGRPNYSRLDLIKDDTPHLGPRIQLMLSQLQFKLNVERQYKDGIEKIMGSYNMDGDRKIRNEAQSRRVESVQKITLLQQALKRYEDLHLDMESNDPADDDSMNAPTLRKPLTGILNMRIQAVSDVNHAASGKLSRGPETFVIVKVEDEFKGRTKATKTDRWTDEYLEIDVDKGNELEMTVYDRSGGDLPRPIGLLWIRISDISEEMRRKRIETELHQAGWVSADKMDKDGRPLGGGQGGSGHGGMAGQPHGGGPDHFGDGQQSQSGPVAIDAWFSLEPVGKIHLTISFQKMTREKKALDAGLGRRGAIRQRQEDVHELYGHKFVAQSFYNIMRCAFCGELLKYATGMQCTDCKYMCHTECYPKVVTKCISKSNAESDPDEAKLNHRIPHRFEPYGNISANWCCHCGYLLPLGRKVPRRCRECKLTAHSGCTHLVPDFCGMTMQAANDILREIKKLPANRAGNVRRPPKVVNKDPSTPSSISTVSSEATMVEQPSRERLSYKEELEQASYRPPSTGAQPPSHPSSQPPSYPPPPSQATHRRPVPPRGDSMPVDPRKHAANDAAIAATQALQNKTPTYDSRPTSATRTSSSYTGSAAQQPSRASPTPPPDPRHAPYDPRAYDQWNAQQQTPVAPQPQSPPQPQPQTSMPPRQMPYNQPAPAASAQMPQQQRYPAPSIPTPEPPRHQVQQPPAPVKSPEPTPAPAPTTQALSPANKFVENRNPLASAQQSGPKKRIGLDHFNFLAVLGKGNFGKVMLAETKSSKQLYAIKVLKKEFIIENDEVESTKSERDVCIIANRARHPFLMNLHACFQTETRVYFVMEYVSGGDLMWHIQRGQFGGKRAQFYAAEVCLALKYFHENGVVYRDLKLDNILLTLDGHIKVADYGLCKKDMYHGSTTSTFCGTPEFMAPEILLDKKYGRAVDWWAFGVLIYQMLLQQSPFRGEDEDEIYDAILADEPLYPIHMPRDSVSILQKLLMREPEQRLGSGPTDAEEIMSHSFFRNINWDDIQNKRVPAPFLPQIKSATDTSNFDSEFTSVTPVLTPVHSVLSQAMQEEFRGFSYSADFV
ncbi:MAG: hypothetical protein Q9162_000198 [Coniocarpon cinnabarinum]